MSSKSTFPISLLRQTKPKIEHGLILQQFVFRFEAKCNNRTMLYINLMRHFNIGGSPDRIVATFPRIPVDKTPHTRGDLSEITSRRY